MREVFCVHNNRRLTENVSSRSRAAFMNETVTRMQQKKWTSRTLLRFTSQKSATSPGKQAGRTVVCAETLPPPHPPTPPPTHCISLYVLTNLICDKTTTMFRLQWSGSSKQLIDYCAFLIGISRKGAGLLDSRELLNYRILCSSENFVVSPFGRVIFFSSKKWPSELQVWCYSNILGYQTSV